ncbi:MULTISPECIES: hypothetical protein [unclassified Mesorhizobium]|uniref:hypothetical protein n=1 Tax=unclassified Mesorhizobium TaxID=325217 RepID=UPI001FE137B7|nr:MULTISPECIES: hypothetical protein [unclassified Mesorhizobium]
MSSASGTTAAGIFEAFRVVAILTALRRVDAVEAHALAVDLDRVAVDHRGDAGDRYRPRFDDFLQVDFRQRPAVVQNELRDQGGDRGDRYKHEPKRRACQSRAPTALCTSGPHLGVNNFLRRPQKLALSV